ncbi:CoA-binding protein [Paractinoplanes rishiriensis]|uniref:CoA-binding domain-containing protein n=1 Tax=Paractinoplanes rishiriensis TaxID=1050105 RepID=A0A919MZW2_9ACTN|nr:CoA-binding protein [Actinoplanes rishiriensis]GIF01770.1 hypothetical protein Ari01nite_92340 [Actinoplanes rishiriensis]
MTKVTPTSARTALTHASDQPDVRGAVGALGHPRGAEPSSLRRVLAPRSVAVVGAGSRHGGTGHEALRALRDYGFGGRLLAVNGSGRPVCGVPTYPSVAALPTRVDLLVVAVPPAEIPDVLGSGARVGAQGAVLLGERLAEQDRIQVLRAARQHHVRVLGPSCLGVLNAAPAVRLNASLSPARPPSGGLALAVQSGALGIALLEQAVRDHCGVSTLVSLGQELDVSVDELFSYWLDDPATRAIALSPESFGDPATFASVARTLGNRKPVLLTGHAQPATADEEALRSAGVIRTAGIGETFDTARMLLDQPLPAGNRMAIVGNADGLTRFTADTARVHGFNIVPLSGPTRAQLPIRIGSTRCDNPVGLGVDTPADRLANVVETIANSNEADILLLTLVGNRSNVLAANVAALAPVLDDHAHLTIAAVVIGGRDHLHRLGPAGAPVFRGPEEAVRAVANARDYAAWRLESPQVRRFVVRPVYRGRTVPSRPARAGRGPRGSS